MSKDKKNFLFSRPYTRESDRPSRISFKVDDIDWELSKEATLKVREYGMTLSKARAIIWKRGVASVLRENNES